MKVHFKAAGKEYFVDSDSIVIGFDKIINKYYVSVLCGVNYYNNCKTWYEFYLDESNKNKLVGCLGSGNMMPIEASEK